MKEFSYTYFSIGGKFNTKEILDKLEIEPVEKWDMGERGKYNNTFDKSFINLVESDKDTFILEEQIDEIVDTLSPKMNILKEIAKTYDVQLVIQVVGKSNNGIMPSISIGRKALCFCYITGTTIDCDLYN